MLEKLLDVATVSAPANCGLRPPDVELDLPAEVVVEFALKGKERDAVVAWVPTPSSLAEDSSQGIDRRPGRVLGPPRGPWTMDGYPAP